MILFPKKLNDRDDSTNKIQLLAFEIFRLVLFLSKSKLISLDPTSVFIKVERDQVNLDTTNLIKTIGL
jgi:hypothetical protein